MCFKLLMKLRTNIAHLKTHSELITIQKHLLSQTVPIPIASNNTDYLVLCFLSSRESFLRTNFCSRLSDCPENEFKMKLKFVKNKRQNHPLLLTIYQILRYSLLIPCYRIKAL